MMLIYTLDILSGSSFFASLDSYMDYPQDLREEVDKEKTAFLRHHEKCINMLQGLSGYAMHITLVRLQLYIAVI